MYDTTLTRQSLPSERYRILLGTAISVFNVGRQSNIPLNEPTP